MRSAPSSRMTSPLRYAFSTMCLTSAAYSSGLPRRDGNGICASSDCRTSSRSNASIGVSAGPGAIVITRMPWRASSRAIGSVRLTTSTFAPSRANGVAVAAPSPDPPPVTKNVLPSTSTSGGDWRRHEPLAKRCLADLPDAGLRELVHELEALRQPPLREVGRQELPQLLGGRRLARPHHDHGERALLPLLVGDRDHG